MKNKSIFLVIIVSAVFLIYSPVLWNGFVWDDTALILRDPLIRSWRLIPEGFNHFLFVDATASDFYRPLQRLAYTATYAAFVFKPAPYHVLSLLCHAAAAVILFFLANELLSFLGLQSNKHGLIAFGAALVWAIHPIQSAAVAYASGLADPLAAMFGFLGLYLVVRSCRQSRNLAWLAGAMVAFLFSALSRESGLMFPVLAVALMALSKEWKTMFKITGVTIAVGLIYLSLRLPANHVPTPVLRAPPPATVRPVVMSRAVAEYAGLILFPLRLHMDRDVESQPTGAGEASITAASWRELQTLLGIVIVAALIYWMIRARRNNTAVFNCLVLAALSYGPVSGISVLNASVAEHWLYVPSAFLFLAAAIQLNDFFEIRRSPARTVAIAAVAIWLAFLGARTFVRTFDWKDQRTFVERTIDAGGNSARMLINLGVLEMSEGKFEDAALHFHSALEKSPDQPLAVINLGALALKQDNFTLAKELLTKATEMPLVEAQAHECLAILEHRETGHVNFLRLRLAARSGPSNWAIEKRYVKALDESGATGKAIDELEHCLATEDYRAESWQLLSQLLARAGRAEPAAIALTMARARDVHLDAHEAR